MEKKTKLKISTWKKVKFILFISAISVLIFCVLAEIFLSIFNPQSYIYPMHRYSVKYERIPYKNTVIEHVKPPHKRYYSVNEYNMRGELIPISNEYDLPNIVLLGDSYTFGIGVNDGYEYASILAENVKSQFSVINTGVGGWGLQEQIRRFYEFGQLYDPKIVFLLFCDNDPDDTMLSNVTKINNGKFEFVNELDITKYRVSKLLGKSIIQKSNLYNVVTKNIRRSFYNKKIDKLKEQNISLKEKKEDLIPTKEKNYIELFNLFVKDLNKRGIKFYFASVNGISENGFYSDVDLFPHIKENILELDQLELIDFIDVNKFMTKDDMAASPIDHYGIKWNKAMGDNLAKLFTKENDTLLKNNSNRKLSLSE